MGSQQIRVATAEDLALSGSTVVAANTRAARHLRLEAERRVFQSQLVCETPDILPLDAWVSRTWTECLLAGVVDRALLRPQVTAALWEQIVANSAAGRELMSHHAAAQVAAEAWQLIHDYKLPRSRATYSSTLETKAFHGWAEKFETRCAQEGWIDGASALASITGNAAKLPQRPKQIVVFGFDVFTPAQQELWQALHAAGTEVVLLRPETQLEHDQAKSLALADAQDEIRTAALWARHKLEQDPRARIGIIVPGLQNLRNTIETVFDECLHPERRQLGNTPSPRSFEISLGLPLGEHPTTRTALRLLRLATSSLPEEELSTLLRSPYFGGGTSERNGRALLDFALRKKLRSTVTLSTLLSEAEVKRSLAPQLCRILSNLERHSKKLPARLSRSDWAAEARRLLTAAGWPGDGPEELTLTSHEFQATSAWDAALADFGALDLVLPPRSAPDLQRELERALAETPFAAENEAAPIQVVGPRAASGESFDALWFCGLTDDVWPQRGHPNPFIPFGLQTQFGMPHSSPEANLREAEQVTARLLQSAGECILSWPRREEDRDLRPSPVLSAFSAIAREALPLASIVGWNQLQEGVRIEEIVDEQAPALTDAEVRTRGTTLLEWQSGCPFRAFAQVRLAAEPLDQGSLGINPRERGQVTELALQYVWEQFRDLQNLRQLTQDMVEHDIAMAIDRALTTKFPKGEDEWLREHREIERTRLNKLIHDWLAVEEKREPFRNIVHQQPIEAKIGELTIRGRADRLEQTNDGAYIILDYKTGGSNYSASRWDVPRPQDPQLPIYAVAQRSEGHEVAGVAFARVRSGDCDFQGEAVRKEIFGKPQNAKRFGEFEQTLDGWQPELERLADNFLEGHAEVDPKFPAGAKSTCRYCHLGSLCRVAEFPAPDDEDVEEVFDDE